MSDSIKLTKKDKDLFRKAQIEIIAYCRNCGQSYCSMKENELIIDKCDCGHSNIENVCRLEDVRNFLREVKP
jgi:hypothetical protein